VACALTASSGCGGSASTQGQLPRDATAPDTSVATDAGPPEVADAGLLEAGDDSDGGDDSDAGDDSAGGDAECTADAGSLETGTPYVCTGSSPNQTCWSGSEFCVKLFGGIKKPAFTTAKPTVLPVLPQGGGGCEPFPCGCDETPGCACLTPQLQSICRCSEDDAGVVTVICALI
jgi:hypothetical protein